MILKVILKKIKLAVVLFINLFRINHDSYVSYFFKNNSLLGILKINKSKFIRSARIKYWHKKASNFPPFLPFFNADELRRAQENTLLNSKVRDIYKSGSAVIDNVLSQEDINLVNNFSDSLQLKAGRTYIQTNLPSSLNEVRIKY